MTQHGLITGIRVTQTAVNGRDRGRTGIYLSPNQPTRTAMHMDTPPINTTMITSEHESVNSVSYTPIHFNLRANGYTADLLEWIVE